MLDKVPDEGVREAVLVRPVRVPEDTVERPWFADSMPRRAFWSARPTFVLVSRTAFRWHSPRNLEGVSLRKVGQRSIAGHFDKLLDLLVIDVADPLEEQQREDVRLEGRSVDRPTEDVGRFPQVTLQLLQLDQIRASGSWG